MRWDGQPRLEAGRRVRDAALRREARPSPSGSYRPVPQNRPRSGIEVAAAESPPGGRAAVRRICRLRAPIHGRDRCRRGTSRRRERHGSFHPNALCEIGKGVKLLRPLPIVQQVGGRSVCGETDDGFSGSDRLEGSTPRDPGRTTPGTESTAPSRAPVRHLRQSDRHQACACPRWESGVAATAVRNERGSVRPQLQARGKRLLASPPAVLLTCSTSSVIRAHPRATSAAAIVDFLPRAGRPGSSRRCLTCTALACSAGGRASAERSRGWGRSGKWRDRRASLPAAVCTRCSCRGVDPHGGAVGDRKKPQADLPTVTIGRSLAST